MATIGQSVVTILGLAAFSDVREYAHFVIEIRNGLGIEPIGFLEGWTSLVTEHRDLGPLGSPLSDAFPSLELTGSRGLVVAFDFFREQFARGGERDRMHEHKGDFKEW
jgi:hypothetical protein